MSSLDTALLLCKRGITYYKVARKAFDDGYYDASSTNCEISAELLIKSTFLYLGYSYPETHQIRKLLSHLSQYLPELKDEYSKGKKKRFNFVRIK